MPVTAGGERDFNLDELRSQIERLDGDTWKVAETLKSAPYEETQLVYRRDSDAGPFVRKLFAEDVGLGDAYETLFAAQVAGVRLTHVPTVYDCSRARGGLAVVMEYVRGETLLDRVRHEGPGEGLAHDVGLALCEALNELHTMLGPPVIHRDVKPENIMLGEGRLVLVDLGIARTWRKGAERDTTRFGTPGYAPPEQFGFGQTGVTGDIYSAGMTIAFCCTGSAPTATLRESHFDDMRIPMWIRPVLVRATQLDPAARFQSALEMAGALREAWDLRQAPSDAHLPQDAVPAAKVGRGDAGRSSSNGSVPYRSRVMDPAARYRPAGSIPARIAKYVWNACVIALYLFVLVFLAGSLRNVLRENPGLLESVLADPVMLVIDIIDFALLFAILTVGAYLPLFKMGLRRHRPFNRLTWRQELPLGIGCIAFAYLVIVLLSLVYQMLG